MARCGCGSSAVCTCLVTAGTNITVTGSGNVGSPYVVSAVVTPVTVLDSPTVDLTLVGQQIRADVILDPDPNNLITDGAGLTLTCTDVQTCFTDGPGIDPIVGGLIQADISTDVGNTLTFGTDTGLFVPAGAFTGLPGVGCGLTGVGTLGSPLIVDTNGAVWPYPCDMEGEGGKVYCSAEDGGLYADPPVRIASLFDSANVTVAPVAVPNDGVFREFNTLDAAIPPIAFAASNPDSCMSALRTVELELDVSVDIPVGGRVRIELAGDEMWSYVNRGTVTQVDMHIQVTKVISAIVGPGLVSPGVFSSRIAATGAAGVTFSRVQWFERVSYVSGTP